MTVCECQRSIKTIDKDKFIEEKKKIYYIKSEITICVRRSDNESIDR
jgi:hypothetical protein